MKKNILLILMFIGMFFIGGTDAFALTCEISEDKCNLENIVDEIKSSSPVCLYSVEVDGKKYYNYILYKDEKYYGGTTKGSADGKTQLLSQNDNAWILGDAYEKLLNQNQCPNYSYIDTKSTNEVCFDNNNECTNGGEKLNSGTNFNGSTSELVADYSYNIKYANYDFKSACKQENIEPYQGVCRYSNERNGNTILLYYNNSKTFILYDELEKGNKYGINYGISFEFFTGKTRYSWEYVDVYCSAASLYEGYKNVIAPINSCPQKIYVYKTNEHVIESATCRDYTYYNISDILPTAIEDKVTYNLQLCDLEENPKAPDPQKCGDIIDGELINIINDIMNIIKIAVPILLICLIIYDFASATFTDSEEKMNKAKSRAIKRVIIAVIVFFVPTIMNLLFDVINEVWDKNFEICGIEEETK